MQRTTNYGLCQYEGSDKTSYLVNYNEDMLKIDTAIKNAADAGSNAGTAASQAQGTADGAAQGVSNLNTQINGENGLAADVATLQGNVRSINSLIGDGHPTTSNQTLIGAVNGIEGAIAPREDGDTLARSYNVGEQFARGGSIYTALTALTAGTAFASLVLNTDYKNSDTLVEQIADVAESVSDIDNNISNLFAIKLWHEQVSVDGTPTTISDLSNAILAKIAEIVGNMANNEGFVLDSIILVGADEMIPQIPRHLKNDATNFNQYVFGAFAGAIQIVTCAARYAANEVRIEYSRIALADGTVTSESWLGTDTMASHNITDAKIKYSIYKAM